MRYKLIGGAHVEEGKVFKTGAVVTSDFDLDRMFPGKFQALSDSVLVTSAPAPDDEDEEGEPLPLPTPVKKRPSAKRKTPAKKDDWGD